MSKDTDNISAPAGGTDIEVALKASMIYWQFKGLNAVSDNGMSNDDIDDVGRIVNGSGDALPNRYKERRDYTTDAYKVLTK